MPGAERPRVPSIRSARTEAKARQAADAARRSTAATILSPEEVSGDYDGGRALMTTLGGDLRRIITQEDLRTFRRNIATIGRAYKGGITAKDVINRSLQVDRDRAQKEIRTAVPVWGRRGQIHFVTNAGPDSDVSRHHVDVILLAHPQVVASPREVRNLAMLDAQGPLKFDCDCGRHTFWYRFIATIGRFNAGRDETGYPKIRNPNLRGVACKHVLRVMKQLTSSPVQAFISKMIEQDRRTLEGQGKAVRTSDAKGRDLAEQQHREAGYHKNQILTQKQRAAHAKLRGAIKTRLQAHAQKMAQKHGSADRDKQAIRARLSHMAAMGAVSQAQVAAVMKALKIK